jgi:streptogramin lyase
VNTTNVPPTKSHSAAARGLRGALVALVAGAGLSPALRAQLDYATPYTFDLFVGAGTIGSADGTGNAAHFDSPAGIAIDSSSGNLFICDKQNETIRMVTPGGVVTTLAGSVGQIGATDDTGSNARFNQPTGICVGSGGDVYVADFGNDTIRKVTPAGVVTTLAGTAGTTGSTDGTGATALFGGPYGVAIDSSGNVYVAEFGNCIIRKITQAGVSSTIAGIANTSGSTDGNGTNALFANPSGIAIDGSGNLYVCDTNNNTIRKITSSGDVTTIAGTAGTSGAVDGVGPAARFNQPRAVTIDSNGNLYVADTGNSAIRKIASDGTVTTLAGLPNQFAVIYGTGAQVIFDVPTGVVVDGTGNLYVTEQLADLVAKGALATSEAPTITTQPQGQTVAAGSTVVFHAGGTGLPAPAVAWFFNGTALADGSGVSGSSGPTLVIRGVTAAQAGQYSFTISNSAGSLTSQHAVLAVGGSGNPGRIINISCRSQVGTGANILDVGFAVGGNGTSGSEPVLVRASGPALSEFDVPGVLPDPQLSLFEGTTQMGSNQGWAGSSEIASAAASVGAFAWNDNSSHDAALLETLTPGTYSAEISGESGDSGVALEEVYDATQNYTPASPRLINISARSQVGTGSDALIAGFVIAGTSSKTVLIRASGPAIAQSVPGSLADPELQLYSGPTPIASNTVWGGDPEISAIAADVGAFAWTSTTSKDSALLVTLPPGQYTAQVTGASGDTGIALIEVYDVQ